MHRARKRFGQHFLHDRNVIDRIVQAIDPQPDDKLVEIGPGQGALTWPLLQRCSRLTAIELDRDLVPVLQREATRYGELEVINADILEFDLANLGKEYRYRLAGNLPYNISTPLMFHLLDSVTCIVDMHFMVQKEVAERIVANSGNRHYGRLSIMLQYYCECHYLFEVSPGSFQPPPKVDSAVIRLLPRAAPQYDVGDFNQFSRIVQAAFAQRRKTLTNSLRAYLDRESIGACGIDPGLRAETLEPGDFAKLSRASLRIC